ncbi:response regulator [Anaerolineales bacterium HSG6]|nr:response regulator [Anaerolineales bacterium HSG6]MDM8532531.1 response regulator [Anaerolineales bacterium HSG25]
MDIEPRILIVDDEENLLRSMEKTLFRKGFDVDTAGGNIEGLNTFKEAAEDEEPFNLVIVDLNMPDFDGNEQKYAGLDLLAAIKKEKGDDVPVIVNSAWDEVEIAKKCIDAGASDYFVKGRNEEMIRKIRAVLEGDE